VCGEHLLSADASVGMLRLPLARIP
jgi:hypothetical protein